MVVAIARSLLVPVGKAADYEAHRENMRKRSAASARTGRDIAPIPKCKNPKRRKATAKNFRLFCETYFPQWFYLAWSEDHLRVLERAEDVALRGGLFAMALPRGGGKTTICLVACIWALVFGYHRFVLLIGADGKAATRLITDLKTAITTNPLLVADFPEVCYPLVRLEGEARRCSGQLCNGEPTNVAWRADMIVLPSIAGSKAAGGTVCVSSLLGSSRGMLRALPSGELLRPSLVLIDDPQKDESARSPAQCDTREDKIRAGILGLGGTAKPIASLMPCTIIAENDLAARFLDRRRHPEWRGETAKLVYAWPTDTALWDEYARLRREDQAEGGTGKPATAFYRKHRAKMDAGARVGWTERYDRELELSAIQHAFNLLIDRERKAFFAEYQNDPIESGGVPGLTEAGLRTRVPGATLGVVPAGLGRLTAFIDVHATALAWLVAAWGDEFNGAVINWGSEQWREGGSREARLHAGLARVVEQVALRAYPRTDGVSLSVERCFIDANWGQVTDLIYRFVCDSPAQAVLTPSHAQYVSPTAMTKIHPPAPGDRRGSNWLLRAWAGRPVPYMVYDANYWKSLSAARLQAPLGGTAAVSVNGKLADTGELFHHFTSESPALVERHGQTQEVWRLRDRGRANHWWDCFVGCAVAASLCGCVLPELTPPPQQPKSSKAPRKRRVMRRRDR